MCVSPVTGLNQLLEELLFLVGATESIGLCRRCFSVCSLSLPRISLPRTVPARLCSVDHCAPQLGPELLVLLLLLLLVGGVLVAAPGLFRRDGYFGGRPLPFLFLWAMLLLGLLLFRRGVGCVDRVSVVKEEEEELGRGRFILLAVSGAGGDACSSNEGSSGGGEWVVALEGRIKRERAVSGGDRRDECRLDGTWSVLKSQKLEGGRKS